jgi:hypothetical protein
MAGKSKKMAAALAAVSLYLQHEEAARGAEQQTVFKEPKALEINPCVLSGRQEMMAMRKLIQLRTFTRF